MHAEKKKTCQRESDILDHPRRWSTSAHLNGGGNSNSNVRPHSSLGNVSSHFHADVVLSPIIFERDSPVGTLCTIEYQASYSFAAVVVDRDVIRCLAVPIVNLE
mgnify:CR=1 FL=1